MAFSWKNPVASFSNNTNIFLNLLEQIRAMNLPCRVLSIGSSEEYGDVDPNDVPLTEHHLLKPVSPYAVARVSQEMLSKIYVDGYGQTLYSPDPSTILVPASGISSLYLHSPNSWQT